MTRCGHECNTGANPLGERWALLDRLFSNREQYGAKALSSRRAVKGECMEHVFSSHEVAPLLSKLTGTSIPHPTFEKKLEKVNSSL